MQDDDEENPPLAVQFHQIEESSIPQDAVGVTVITGYLGSGKSTVSHYYPTLPIPLLGHVTTFSGIFFPWLFLELSLPLCNTDSAEKLLKGIYFTRFHSAQCRRNSPCRLWPFWSFKGELVTFVNSMGVEFIPNDVHGKNGKKKEDISPLIPSMPQTLDLHRFQFLVLAA